MPMIKQLKFFCLSFFILCLPPVTQAKPLPKIAKLLPPETLLLLETADFQQLKEQFEKTSIYRLYKDPAMAAFVADAKTKLTEKIKTIGNNEVFKTIVDANALPQGKVAFAIIFNEQTIDVQQLPFLFIAQWGQHISQIKEAVEKTAKKAVENGAYKKTENYRGVNITTIIKDKPLKQAENIPTQNKLSGKTQNHYCFIDDCLIVSANLDALKFVIAHIKGATSYTLADEPDYGATMKTVGAYYDIELFVNIKQLIKTILSEDANPAELSTITCLGLDNVAALGCAVGIARQRQSSFSIKTFLKINGPKKGIFKMLDFESAPFRIPKFIPSTAYSITLLNLDLKKTYNEFVNVISGFSPQAAAVFYMPLPTSESEDIPGLKIKDDIINYLGSQVIVTQSINKPFSENTSPTKSLLALAVNSRSALEKSMAILHDKIIAPNNPQARRQLLGHTIYTIGLGQLPFFGGGITPMQNIPEVRPQMPKTAFTITDTHLLFGSESTIEKAIRTLNSASSSSVSSANWFRKGRSAIPSVAGLATIEDSSATAELFWWIAKQAGKTGDNTASGSAQRGLGQLVSAELLPKFETVRKYFGLHAYYIISRENGFFLESKGLDFAENTTR